MKKRTFKSSGKDKTSQDLIQLKKQSASNPTMFRKMMTCLPMSTGLPEAKDVKAIKEEDENNSSHAGDKDDDDDLLATTPEPKELPRPVKREASVEQPRR